MDSKSGKKMPRPLGEAGQGKRPGEVRHFDHLHMGESGPLGGEGMDGSRGFKYLLILLDDLSNFVWLEPADACTARLTAQHLLNWSKTRSVPDVWMSATATHFKNKILATLEKALGVERRFTVASRPWSNGTCERMIRDVVHTMKAILQERRGSVRDWALNTAYRE